MLALITGSLVLRQHFSGVEFLFKKRTNNACTFYVSAYIYSLMALTEDCTLAGAG